jgi:hypothetical protein
LNASRSKIDVIAADYRGARGRGVAGDGAEVACDGAEVAGDGAEVACDGAEVAGDGAEVAATASGHGEVRRSLVESPTPGATAHPGPPVCLPLPTGDVVWHPVHLFEPEEQP